MNTRTHHQPRHRRPRDERGSTSLFFVVIVMALFIAIGLVVDAGGKIRALQQAEAAAAEAARAGGQAIQGGPAMEGNGGRVDAARAKQAAQQHLNAAGIDGTVTIVNPTTLRVTTTTTYDPVFLSLIGMGELTTTGEAEARLVSVIGDQEVN